MAVKLGYGFPFTANGVAGPSSCNLTCPFQFGENRALVLVAIENSASEIAVSSAQYDGKDISAYQVSTGFSSFHGTTVWVVPNPKYYSDFRVVYASAPSAIVLMAAYFTGVDQIAPYRTPVSSANDPEPAASPATVDVSNSEVDDLIVGIFSLNDTSTVDGFTSARCGSGQTFVGQYTDASVQAQGAICTEPGASGTVTVDWTYATTSGWRAAAIALKPAPDLPATQKTPRRGTRLAHSATAFFVAASWFAADLDIRGWFDPDLIPLTAPSTERRAQLSWAELEVPNGPRRAQMSWAELEVPNVPHRAQVSWAELEVPTAPRRAQVSWAELETPNGPRRARVSWAELEVPALTTTRRALLSWAELEVPTAPRRGRVSWAEFEVPDSVLRRARVSWAELEVPNGPRRARVSFAELEVPSAGEAPAGPEWFKLRGILRR